MSAQSKHEYKQERKRLKAQRKKYERLFWLGIFAGSIVWAIDGLVRFWLD